MTCINSADIGQGEGAMYTGFYPSFSHPVGQLFSQTRFGDVEFIPLVAAQSSLIYAYRVKSREIGSVALASILMLARVEAWQC